MHDKNYTITTPLYYANDIPHIGSAYTTIAADALSRFHRLQGYKTLLITGTDEHGLKIQRSAKNNNKDTQEFCNEISGKFQQLWQELNIQHDQFIRTTSPLHKNIVEQIFKRVWDNGDIYLSNQKGWYCVHCEEFKDEKEIIDGNCPIHSGKKVEWRDEQNYFFRLSKYQSQIEEYHRINPDFIQPTTRRNEILNFVAQGLNDFSISRTNLDWGIPVPVNNNHTIYVWFDALVGYITALCQSNPDIDLNNIPRIDTHLIGKDILRFHTIYWPAILLSANLPLPKKVYGHGFLTKDGSKISKTLGNTINPFDLVKKYESDAIRYFLLKDIEFGKDGDFNESRFINTINSDLANEIGNLLYRTLTLANRYFNGTILLDNSKLDNELKANGIKIAETINARYKNLEISQSCRDILKFIKLGNKFIDNKKPWELYKQGKHEQLQEILYSILESIRLTAFLLAPITPNLSNKIYSQLGIEINFNSQDECFDIYTDHSRWGYLNGQKFQSQQQIFHKLT